MLVATAYAVASAFVLVLVRFVASHFASRIRSWISVYMAEKEMAKRLNGKTIFAIVVLKVI